jgi:putative ABC transport system permease protein
MIPIKYNVRNLIVRRATTLATALGIGLVVFVLAATLMLTEGLKKTLNHSGSRDTAIVLRKGADAELASGIGDEAVRLIQGAPGIKMAEGGTPLLVGEVVAVLYQTLSNGKGKSNLLLRGVPEQVGAFRPEVTIVEGRWPKPGTTEAMVGASVRKRFVGTDLGGTPELRKNRNVEIVGVFEANGSSYESELWADIEVVREAFGRENQVSSVRVRLESPALFDGFSAAVESDKRLGLTATREPEFYEQQSENTALFITAMGSLIAIFFAVGAMIGAMITMYGAWLSARKRSELCARSASRARPS